ncbi:MAG: NAD(P)-dependent oxidoreductase [Caulobacteraceae bacterium]
MRVLVTGAGGFLGGAIYRRLAARGDLEVIASARSPIDLAPDAIPLDLASSYAVAKALELARPDVVVHAAGRAHGSRGELYFANTLPTVHLAAALGMAAPTGAIILLSSAARYGRSESRTPWRESNPDDPIGEYGFSKESAEAHAFAEARRSGLRVASLRIFNVVAPEPHGEQAFPAFLRKLAAAMAGPPPWWVEMGDLSAIRDFVALDDVLRAVERVIDRGVWGEPINVCTGVGRPVRTLLEDVSLAIAGAAPGAIEIAESGPPPELDWSVGDPAKHQALLGFTPSSDLSALTAAAAAWVRIAAAERADA